jgi:DMSO/TMAO reductase YedYZ molybdopterin-dependent catalytic subunit
MASPEAPVIPLDRRRFLAGALALPLLPFAPRLRGQSPPATGRIIRQQSPLNLETNFAGLDGFVTPTSAFYIRDHFPQPKIDPAKWQLKVEGAVERPLDLSLDEIKKLGERTRPLLLECAGNGRVYLTPPAKGVNWQLGAVGAAEWTGVPLAAVLERAGVKNRAVEVVLEGADTGVVADPPSPGPIAFARSLPLAKARRPETMLAWGMNGADLPAEHGAPLRAVVGGWYGMASVKWLSRILVVEQPFGGFFQTLDYTYFRRVHGLPSLTPITALSVKAQIARPVQNEVLPAGRPCKIIGAAWAGEADVAKVEVSADGGKTWTAAALTGENKPFCWRLWEFDWKSPAAGKMRLMARATDSKGAAQPMQRDPDRRNYMISHVLPVDVEVR